jgi:hypothetical protein
LTTLLGKAWAVYPARANADHDSGDEKTIVTYRAMRAGLLLLPS